MIAKELHILPDVSFVEVLVSDFVPGSVSLAEERKYRQSIEVRYDAAGRRTMGVKSMLARTGLFCWLASQLWSLEGPHYGSPNDAVFL